MIAPTWLTVCILLSLVSAYNCASMSMTAIKILNNLNLICFYQLDLNEVLSQFIMVKDNKTFYSFTDSTKNKPKFIPIPGVSNIDKLEPGQISILNVNATTSGNYTCQLFYNNNKTSLSKNLTLTKIDNSIPNLKANLVMSPLHVTNDQVKLNCSSKFIENETFSEIGVSKDQEYFYLWSDSGDKENQGLKGNQKNDIDYLNVTQNEIAPYLAFTIKASDWLPGQYQCKVIYKNGSDSYFTQILSNPVQVSSANLISNANSVVLYLATIILLVKLIN